jgi:hypothetical protein
MADRAEGFLLVTVAFVDADMLQCRDADDVVESWPRSYLSTTRCETRP